MESLNQIIVTKAANGAIKMKPLDNLDNQYNSIGFLKIDGEGLEPEALSSAKQLL